MASVLAACVSLWGCAASYVINGSRSDALALSTDSVNFGNVRVGQSVVSQVVLTNQGPEPIQISQLSIAGGPFALTGQTPASFTISPGSTAKVNLQFSPVATGAAEGELSLASSSAAGAFARIRLHGVGTAILRSVSCASTSITGAGSDTCVVTLSSAPQGDGITVNLASSNAALAVPASVTIAKDATSASFTAEVAAVPSTQTATISATTGQESASSSLQLNTAISMLGVSATTVNFGNIPVGKTASQTVLLSSIGTVPVTVSSISIMGASFAASGMTTPFILNPGQTASLTLTFHPQNGSNFTGVLTISTDSSTGNIPVSMNGEGVGVLSTVSCSSSTISGAATDLCTAAMNGPAPNGGYTIDLASNNAAVVIPPSVNVPAGASSAVFTATIAAVTSSQTATITASSGANTALFALQLNPPDQGTLQANATAISFGGVSLNNVVTQTVVLTASGGAVTISSAKVRGTAFSLSETSFPLTLNAGQAITLNVQFAPLIVGSATGRLTIFSNSAGSGRLTVSLSGTGLSAKVQLHWAAPSGAADSIVGYNIYRALAGWPSYQRLNASPEPETSYGDSAVQSGQSYQYYVVSVDTHGRESVPSNSTVVTIP